MVDVDIETWLGSFQHAPWMLKQHGLCFAKFLPKAQLHMQGCRDQMQKSTYSFKNSCGHCSLISKLDLDLNLLWLLTSTLHEFLNTWWLSDSWSRWVNRLKGCKHKHSLLYCHLQNMLKNRSKACCEVFRIPYPSYTGSCTWDSSTEHSEAFAVNTLTTTVNSV